MAGLQMPEGPKVPKDTTPKPVNPVRYLVRQTTFVNGQLVQPLDEDGKQRFVTAEDGLAGAALVRVDDKGNPIDVKPEKK